MRQTVRLLCASALLLAACHKDPAESADDPGYRVDKDRITLTAEGPLAFHTAEARVGPALPLPTVTARITTVEALTSPSFAPLAGRVVETKVRLGDHVQKGQQLVLVRTADLPALQRELRSAELAVSTRSASVERMRALVASRAGAEHDLILSESELAEAKLERDAARARLQSLQISRSKDDTAYWVLATRAGTVVQIEATTGAQVGPDRTPVATVADLAEVLAVADVSPRDALSVTRDAPAQVFALGSAGEKITGKVEGISDVVDPERQTVPVRVRIDNRARMLRPNAYVDLALGSTHEQTSVLLPTAAVVRDGPTSIVFVETNKASFARRKVVVGRTSAEEVEVLSGLQPGERVVTTGALLLLNALDVEA